MFHRNKKHVSLEGKSVSVTFYLKSLKNHPKDSSVVARIVYGRKKVELSTGIRVPTDTWSERKQESNISSIINRRLGEIKIDIYDTKLMLDNKGIHYTVKDIKSYYLGDSNNIPTLLEFWDIFINFKNTNGDCGQTTLLKYKATHRYLEKFLGSISCLHLRLQQWDKKKINDFNLFLNQQIIDNKGTKMKQTTINKHHVKLKTILNYAISLELIGATNPYTEWKLTFPYKNREYLDNQELHLIENTNLKNNQSLDKARDIFM